MRFCNPQDQSKYKTASISELYKKAAYRGIISYEIKSFLSVSDVNYTPYNPSIYNDDDCNNKN